MKKILTLNTLLMLTSILGCQDMLDIANPNLPTPESVKNEHGIISFAQGALYVNGELQDFFSNVLATHERMGDMIGSRVAPAEVYCPDLIILDNGTNLKSIHPEGQKHYLRTVNIPSNKFNVFYPEWRDMYSLNNAMNTVLQNVEQIEMSIAKKNTVQAWAYFWKGFAYSRIGSRYCAGIVTDIPFETNSNYVTKEEVMTAAEYNFSNAENLLSSITDEKQFNDVLSQLIPSICQTGKGSPLSTHEWLRHINTMRARNILVNNDADAMTASQWAKVIELTSDGIKQDDNTFTLRTDELGNLLWTYGYVAALAIGPEEDGGGFEAKVSERLAQEFRAGDLRFANNFKVITPWIGPNDRGTGSNTRYLLVNKGSGIPGVVVMVDTEIGAHELYIAGSYEENVLMLAEANIYSGNIDTGLSFIDELRSYQGSGLQAIAGTGVSIDQAKEELRSERRIGLAFRGFSFYDARRWNVLKNGRTGCVVVDFSGNVSTGATIQYGYMEYWDVPVFESYK
jgi:hypothetical protein